MRGKNKINSVAIKLNSPPNISSQDRNSEVPIPVEEKLTITDPVKKQAMEILHKKIEDFSTVAQSFSTFEATMAGFGMLTTKFQADWTAYFAESICEFVENSMFTEDGVPEIFKPFLGFIADINGIRGNNGQKIRGDDIAKHKERVVGGLNRFTSTLAVLNTKFQVIKNFIYRNKEKPEINQSAFGKSFSIFSKGVLPMVNALFMWISGAAKKNLANTIQEISPHDHNKEEVNGVMTSGNQDKLCGLNSALLMIRQGISIVSPKLAFILEPVFAIYISVKSFIEGHKAVKEIEDEDSSAKYTLNGFDKTGFGKWLYQTARDISKVFKVELPSLTKLEEAKSSPEILLAA